MLDVSGMTVKFGGLAAVSGLSFQLRRGEILAIIGPNGAGKTSVFNALTGFVPLSEGTVTFETKPLNGLPPHRVAARGISRTFQRDGIMRGMTVLENVITGLELTTASTFAGAIFGLPASSRAERAATASARAVLASIGMAGFADKTAGDLPPGQQRLVEIARALVSGARLLLLDEPAAGLFETERMIVCSAISRVAAAGVGILLIEHVQPVVRAVANRVLVMNQGRKVAECEPDELSSHKAVLEAYLEHA